MPVRRGRIIKNVAGWAHLPRYAGSIGPFGQDGTNLFDGRAFSLSGCWHRRWILEANSAEDFFKTPVGGGVHLRRQLKQSMLAHPIGLIVGQLTQRDGVLAELPAHPPLDGAHRLVVSHWPTTGW